MPRSARIQYPNGVFHIISRCHNNDRLLEGTEERDRYLDLIGRAQARTDAKILAWCIMSTHAHVVVQAGKEPLSRLTKPMNTGYAVWKNRKDGRVGEVFADRPKMLLVEAESYLLELVRYVHLNPLRAGLVDRPEATSWSSHQCYLGLVTPPDWLHTGLVMEHYSGGSRGVAEFAEFVNDAIGEPRRTDFAGELDRAATLELRRALGAGAEYSDPILGSHEFVKRVTSRGAQGKTFSAQLTGMSHELERIPGLRELVAASCVVMEVDEANFSQRPKLRASRLARQILTWLWVKQFGQRQSEIARYLNVGRDQVARWYGNAIDTFEELEPTIRKVFASLPLKEPELTGEPTDVHINVKVVKD